MHLTVLMLRPQMPLDLTEILRISKVRELLAGDIGFY